MLVMLSTAYNEPVPQPLLSGVVLSLVPASTPGFGIEVQSASDVGGGIAASSAAATIVILDPPPKAGITYLDHQPVDGNKRFYRGREVEDGWTPSAWTAWTTGHKPVQLSPKDLLTAAADVSVYPLLREMPLNDGQMTLAANDTGGAQPSSGLYMPSTQKITVGLLAATSFVSKFFLNSPQNWTAFDPGPAPRITGTYIYSTSTDAIFHAPINPIPYGSKLIGITAWVNLTTSLGTTQDYIKLQSSPTSDPSVVTDLRTVLGPLLTSSSLAGLWMQTSSGLGSAGAAHTFGSSNFYRLETHMVATLIGSTDDLIGTVAVEYQMPTYDVTR